MRKTKEELAALEAQEIGATGAIEGGDSSFPARGRGRGRGRGERGGARGDRGGRGRGGAGAGRGGFKKEEVPVTASGVFSMGSVVTGKKQVVIERRLDDKKPVFSGMRYGKSKKEPKMEDGNYKEGYASDASDEPKVSVEALEELSDEEFFEDDKLPSFPIRAGRTEHAERHAVVNTESIGRKRVSKGKSPRLQTPTHN